MATSSTHRLILFAASGILAFALGFFLIPAATAMSLVRYGGYFATLAAFVLFVAAIFRMVREDRKLLVWTRFHWQLAALSLGISTVWQLLAPHGFKILMDEYVLSATAMSLHFDREVFVTLRAHNFSGTLMAVGGLVDKRPVFFPFLLSLIHDLTGYRSGNVFALNAVLSFACLFLSGLIGRRVGRHDNGGFLAVLLLAGLPLLISNATGAGFEVLNLVMILSTMLLAIHYLERPDATRLSPLIMAAVLLAQTRYESALYVVSAGIVVLAGWRSARRITVPWSLVAAPLLLLIVPLQNKLFLANKGYWQLTEESEGPFRSHLVSDNFGHTVGYFFNLDGFRLGSPVLSAFGIICLLVVMVYTIRRIHKLGSEPETIVFAAFALCVILNFILLLSYYWGQLDDYMASRLGLPLLLFFALSSAFVTGRNARRPLAWGVLFALPALWGFLGAIPIASRAEMTKSFHTFREMQWAAEFIEQHRNQNDFFILPSSLPAILKQEPSISIEVACERAEGFAYHLSEGTYNNIYVFQHIDRNSETGEATIGKNSNLPPEFVLEQIEERMMHPLVSFRLSRLAAIDLSKQAPRPPDWKPKFPRPEPDPHQDGNNTANGFLSEFIQNLP